MCGLGVPVGCRMKHAKGMFKRAIRSHGCVALGWLLAASMPSQRFKGFKVFKGLKRLEGFKGLRAGKRHKKPLMCGLGVPVGCRMKHAKGLFKRPIRSH